MLMLEFWGSLLGKTQLLTPSHVTGSVHLGLVMKSQSIQVV